MEQEKEDREPVCVHGSVEECTLPGMCVWVLSFQEMSCCLSKRFSVKAIHRLLPPPPPLLYPSVLMPIPLTQCPPKPRARLPLVSAEQMPLNCPPPPFENSIAAATLNRPPCRRAKQATPDVWIERGGGHISTGRRGHNGGGGGWQGRNAQRGSVFRTPSVASPVPSRHPPLPYKHYAHATCTGT